MAEPIITKILYLVDAIEESEPILELCNALYTAKSDEVIVLKIASSGGDVELGAVLADAMRYCPVDIVAHVVSSSMSMAAMLALGGSNLILDSGTFLMFHAWSSGGGNQKHSDEILYHPAMTKSLTQLFYNQTTPFLSRNEVKSILSGKDLYIHWDDPTLPTRIKRHFKV